MAIKVPFPDFSVRDNFHINVIFFRQPRFQFSENKWQINATKKFGSVISAPRISLHLDRLQQQRPSGFKSK